MNETESLSQALGQPGKMILATLFIVIGLAYLGFAPRLIAMRAWWMKRTLGAEFKPSEKTVRMYRIFGALVLAGGLALYAGIL